ncbi:MAG: SGNH/GDSL hydrolase family protein [Planctomycetaceae bacterium]
MAVAELKDLPVTVALSARHQIWFTSEVLPFLAVAAQFALIVALTQALQLETWLFQRVMKIALLGFVIHHVLPERARLPFFACLSLAATLAVLGAVPGLSLIGIGLGLIAMCHLPLPFWARVTLIGAATAGLALTRANSQWFPAALPIWPILGSMFAFRMMVYLYDLKHRNAPFSPSRALAYFFMLPNVCFPLFPVVDYKTFCSTYRHDDRLRTYQTGLHWMLRGIVQLVLYRAVYQFGLMDVVEVQSATDVARYMVSTYLLYLRVSGQFHLIVGLLHMFGFNLPETHHLYLLASSFTDFWRRINIYWKDFIMKLFFYPAFFIVKKIGTLKAMALATIVAFFATWVLHSWQWFWIRGSFLITTIDSAFWAILAALVLINVLWEATAGRRRTLNRKQPTGPAARLVTGLKTAGTFAVICTLWTFWSSQSWDEVELLYASAFNCSWSDAAVILGGLAVIAVAGVLWGGSTRETTGGSATTAVPPAPFNFWRSAAALSAAALCLLAVPRVGESGKLPPKVELAIGMLRINGLNFRDLNLRRRGYYEDLDDQTVSNNPPGWTQTKNLYRTRDDFLEKDLVPLESGVLGGVRATTNRWGLRDRDYEKEKPPGTYRILLMGSSHEFGSGVNDDETFENLAEDRLNRHLSAGDVTRYEILNLSLPGDGVLQQLLRLEKSGLAFAPDAVLFALHCFVDNSIVDHLSDALRVATVVPFPEIMEVVDRAGARRGMTDPKIRQRLLPVAPEIAELVLKRLKQLCDERNIKLMLYYRPSTLDDRGLDTGSVSRFSRLAAKYDLTLIDLSPAYANVIDRHSLVLAAWDDHTNAYGHGLLADRLYESLLRELASQQATPR